MMVLRFCTKCAVWTGIILLGITAAIVKAVINCGRES